MRNGWTLVELLSALLIVSVVVVMVIPSFRRMMASNRLRTRTGALVEALHTAQLTAISQNAPVTFCRGRETKGCDNRAETAVWITFVDHDHNGALDAEDRLIAVTPASSRHSSVWISRNGPFRKGLVFVPTGMPQRLSGAFGAGRLRVCVPTSISPNAMDIVLSYSGRTRVQAHDFHGKCPAL